jgi:hypothetical protein
MAVAHGSHATEFWMVRIAPGIDDREFAPMWRELARPVSLFDEASPANISCRRNRRNL